ncbi:MAG TPA: hypothetical protein VF142_16370 [Longimicrobium sp.]
MALREFRDSRGTEWTAWDVPPHRIYERARSSGERRSPGAASYQPERRSGRDRRRRVLHPHLQAGWVCFTSGREKRRLYPPPPQWHAATDEELEALCARAVHGAGPEQ